MSAFPAGHGFRKYPAGWVGFHAHGESNKLGPKFGRELERNRARDDFRERFGVGRRRLGVGHRKSGHGVGDRVNPATPGAISNAILLYKERCLTPAVTGMLGPDAENPNGRVMVSFLPSVSQIGGSGRSF